MVGGTWYGSMAVVADGWHMATHAAALGRGHAGLPLRTQACRTTLASPSAPARSVTSTGFASARVAADRGVADRRAGSGQRLVSPVEIDFLQAGGIAVGGPWS